MILSLVAAQAATLVVGPGGYATVQDAVDASAPGDRISIPSGTFQETLVLPHALLLEGQGLSTELTSTGLTLDVEAGVSVGVRRLELGGRTCAEVADGGHLDLRYIKASCGETFTIPIPDPVTEKSTPIQTQPSAFPDLGFGQVVETHGDATLLIRDSEIVGSILTLAEGIRTSGATHVIDSGIRHITGMNGGALQTRGPLIVSGTSFHSNTAGATGGALTLQGDAWIVGSDFRSNSAPEGGAVWAQSSDRVHAYANTFCENIARGTGGAVHLSSTSKAHWANNVFAGTQGDSTVALRDVVDGWFLFNTFVHNQGGVDQSGAGLLNLDSNLFAWTDAIAARHATLDETHSLFWSNGADLVPGPPAPTSIRRDPLIGGLPSPTDACEKLPFVLGFGSPALGSGNPAERDPNSGADPDIGATGQGSSFSDTDGDGTPDPYDCGDASVGFHVAEICGNGIDDDCDGLIDAGPFDVTTAAIGYVDADGDGFGTGQPTLTCSTVPMATVGGDCDDDDMLIHPDAEEVCNGQDDDCDPNTPDPGVPGLYHPDGDGDGFGELGSTPTYACDPSAGALLASDCDDSDPMVNPDAEETCNDADDDCNTLVDDGLIFALYRVDGDGDGFGSGDAIEACENPTADHVASPVDCDDQDPNTFPGAEETCNGLDDDCDDDVDEELPLIDSWRDSDGDGFGSMFGDTRRACGDVPAAFATNRADCDDGDPTVTDGSPWTPDADGDGFGAIGPGVLACDRPPDSGPPTDCDDSDPTLSPNTLWFVDGDGDGLGDPNLSPLQQCDRPGTRVQDSGDCDDTDADLQGDAMLHRDADGDGYGAALLEDVCTGTPGYVANGDDCDDTAADLNPDTSWFVDADGDGFGVASAQSIQQCTPPAASGWSSRDDDCDDTDDTRNPTTPWYPDTDGDGDGSGSPVQACTMPADHAATNDDCDPTDPDVAGPVDRWLDTDGDGYGIGTPERRCAEPGWAPLADDCAPDDPLVNPATIWYADADGDGHGDPLTSVTVCAPVGMFVQDDDDCDDGDAGTAPGADEVCDQVDNDCNDLVDDAPTDAPAWFLDADQDGWGDAPLPASCTQPPGAAGQDGDCQDGIASINPAAIELCDQVDNDCNDLVDDDPQTVPWYQDLDGDGFGDVLLDDTCVPVAGAVRFGDDCDDDDLSISPLAAEVCDQVDNDCDGDTDEDLLIAAHPDVDGDGFGAIGSLTVDVCELGVDQSLTADDCDDTAAAVNPMATDLPGNGIDEDCDGADALVPGPSTADTSDPGDTGDTGDTSDTAVPPVPVTPPPPATPPPATVVPVTPVPPTEPVEPTTTTATPAQPGTALWYCSAQGSTAGLWVLGLAAALTRRRRH